MNRRVVAALCAAVLGLAPAVAAAAAVVPTTSPVAQQVDPTLAALAGCIRSRGSLDVLFLMDESSSLQTTDPDHARVTAAQAAVKGLTGLVNPAPTVPPVRVQVAVASFARDFHADPWHDLDRTGQALEDELGAYATRDQGDATDYVLALDKARQLLSEQDTAAGGRPPCQAVVWFTDGQFDPVGDVSRTDAIEEGTHRLCDAGGVIDQFRGTGATLLTVALTKDMNARSEGFLRSVTGVGPGCGTAAPTVNGLYLAADDRDTLVADFTDLVQFVAPLPCAGSATDCEFTLEPQLSSFYVLIQSGSQDVSLQPPNGGQPVKLDRAGAGAGAPVSVAGASLSWAWIDHRTLTVRGVLAADSAGRWSGAWHVTAATNGRQEALSGRVYLFGDLAPKIIGRPEFVRGRPWHLQAEIDANGRPAPDADLRALGATFAVSFTDGADTRSGTVTPVAGRANTVDVDFTAPSEWHSATVTVTVGLRVRTANGVDISPGPMPTTFPVTTPLAMAPVELRPMPITGHGDTTATLAFTAGATGGCVWVNPAAVRFHAVPVDIAATTEPAANGRNSCLRVEPGQSKNLTVRFAAGHGWVGTANGTVPVMMSVDGSPPITVDVQTSFGLVPDQGVVFWSFLLVALLLSLSPLAGWVVFNHTVLSRFDLPRSCRVATIAVTVRPRPDTGGVVVEEFEGSAWPGPNDVRRPSKPPRRRFTAGPATFRVRCSRLKLFAEPQTHAFAAGGDLVATAGAGPSPVLRDLPTRLAGVVVVTAPVDRGDKFRAQVVAVLDDGPLTADRARAIREAAATAAARLLNQPDRTEQMI